MPRTRGLVEPHRVVRPIPRDADHVAGHRTDEIDAHGRIVDGRLRQRLRDDHAGAVNTKMQLLPAPRATLAVFRGGPFALAHDGESRTVEDEMQRTVGRDGVPRDVQPLTPARERRVVGSVETRAHHGQTRPDEALGLA